MAVANHELPAMALHEELPPPQHQTTAQGQGVEALKDVAFGSIAGVLGKFVEYPFDTIKVRLQSQSTHPASTPLKGPLDAFVVAWRSPSGPVKSLYRGISAPLFGAAIETSSLFFSYRIAQEILISSVPSLHANKDPATGKVELPFSALLGCGAASGAFTSILLTPIELIKCKMQVPLSPSSLGSSLGYQATTPPGPVQLIRSIFQAHGILGFWHGQLGTLIRETGGSASWFGSYEAVKILLIRYENSKQKLSLSSTTITADDLKVWQQMLAGAAAGVSYNFAFYPADTIKSRMQTADTSFAAPSENKAMTFMGTGKELWRQQGLKGFYRGCGITVFRAAPSSAIIFSIYEGLRKYFA